MGLFKEVHCAHCGAKVGMLARKWLKDGSCVCSKCASVIPGFVRQGLPDWTYQEFTEVLRYVEYSKNVIAPVFRATHSYQQLSLDAAHGYFCYDNTLFGQKFYLQVEDVDSIDLSYEAEKFKEGFLNDKVTGDVKLVLRMKFPVFWTEQVLATGVKSGAKLKKGIFSDKVSYGNPKGMDEFISAFMETHQTFLYRDIYTRFHRDYVLEAHEIFEL